MKIIKHFTRYHLIILFLSVPVIFGCADIAPKPPIDALAGWQVLAPDYLQANKTIASDSQDYLHANFSEKDSFVIATKCFEDGTGCHAVSFQIVASGLYWNDILFYDKDNQRVKTTKYQYSGSSNQKWNESENFGKP